MAAAGLIEELLSEQTRVIAELDLLNTQIEEVLRAISPPPVEDESADNDATEVKDESVPPNNHSGKRRAA